MGIIDEILQVVRSAQTNNVKELRVRQLVNGGHGIDLTAPWETVSQICNRLHISPSKFRRRWKRRPQDSGGRSELGPTGRTNRVQSNKPTDIFLQNESHLGGITPEQIVKVTIEVAPPEVKGVRLEPGKRHKSLISIGKAS